MAITRVYSTWVIGVRRFSLSCFPASVNWLLLSRDSIAGDGRRFAAALRCHRCFGIRVLIESKVDYNKAQNLIRLP